MLEGWLNTDIRPRFCEVAYVDATQPLPFDDETFDYIFSEHLIEHLFYEDGFLMLQECFRVLRSGGRVRIATPNLVNIVGLLAANKSGLARRYIKWAVDEHIPYADAYRASFVINNFFWDFRHLFVYDAETLQSTLERAGFTTITTCCPGESDDENLRGLESHGKQIGQEMNEFETMVFEASRPA